MEKGGLVWLVGHSFCLFDIEEHDRMQKEKPRFEAIPNWHLRGLERV
jgi:hypothetical protein